LQGLHVEEHGEGETLLLHQGLGQGAWAWMYTAAALAERFHTITFDTRGTGRSRVPNEPYGIDDLADDATEILDGRAAHVVGFSMGGYVALTLALKRPELVRKLVLAGTGAGGPSRVPRPSHVREAFEEAMLLPPEEARRKTMPYTFAAGWTEANPGPVEEIVAASLEHPTPIRTIEAHMAACYRFYAQGIDVERIDAPTLVVHSTDDLIVPTENGRELARRLPNARYVELAGRGHNLFLQDPEPANELLLDFLAEG